MPQGQPLSVPDDGLTTRQRRTQPLLVVHTGEGKGKFASTNITASRSQASKRWNSSSTSAYSKL